MTYFFYTNDKVIFPSIHTPRDRYIDILRAWLPLTAYQCFNPMKRSTASCIYIKSNFNLRQDIDCVHLKYSSVPRSPVIGVEEAAQSHPSPWELARRTLEMS